MRYSELGALMEVKEDYNLLSIFDVSQSFGIFFIDDD